MLFVGIADDDDDVVSLLLLLLELYSSVQARSISEPNKYFVDVDDETRLAMEFRSI